MKPIVVWVLLIDSRRARILENRGRDTGLIQLPGQTHEAPETLPYSDDEGRALVGKSGARVRIDKRIEHTPESIEFVRRIVDVLTEAHRHGKYDHLVISASPSMLGLMRQHLPKELSEVVKCDLARDLVNVPTNDLPEHFAGILQL